MQGTVPCGAADGVLNRTATKRLRKILNGIDTSAHDYACRARERLAFFHVILQFPSKFSMLVLNEVANYRYYYK